MPMRMEMTIRSTRKTAKYPPIIVMERSISAARVDTGPFIWRGQSRLYKVSFRVLEKKIHSRALRDIWKSFFFYFTFLDRYNIIRGAHKKIKIVWFLDLWVENSPIVFHLPWCYTYFPAQQYSWPGRKTLPPFPHWSRTEWWRWKLPLRKFE